MSVSAKTPRSVARVGFIGAGTVAEAIAAHALRAGCQVVLSNSRGPETLEDLVDRLGSGAAAGTAEQAAQADVIVLAVPWPVVRAALEQVNDWTGRVLVDATNQFADGRSVPDDLGETTGSEVIAALADGAKVVKAFGTLYGPQMAADPRRDGGRLLLFYAGDDDDANRAVRDFATRIGFAAVRIGGLRDGGRLMQLGGPLSGLHAIRLDPSDA